VVRAGFPLGKKLEGVLDVFIDTRARLYNEDIRIDHHGSGEPKTYRNKRGIILEDSGKYASCVGLIRDVFFDSLFNHPVDEKIIDEANKADAGDRTAVFSQFRPNVEVVKRIFQEKEYAITVDAVKDFNLFISKLERAFGVTKIERTDVQKQATSVGMHVVSGPGFNLIVDKEGKSLESKDSDWFRIVFGELKAKCDYSSKDLKVYIVGGFQASANHYINEKGEIKKEKHAEPYQVFISHNGVSKIDIGSDAHGEILQPLKEEIITRFQPEYKAYLEQLKKAGYKAEQRNKLAVNGGGRDSVGGLNFHDKKIAQYALAYVKDLYVKKIMAENL